MYRTLIAGAGYVGGAIAAYFRSKNQKVWGIIQTPERQSALEQIGVVPIIVDVTCPETLTSLPAVDFVVIALSPVERNEENYRRIYLEGIRNLLFKIKTSFSPLLIVYISSSGVYPDLAGKWVDEVTEPKPDTEEGKILLEAEKQVLTFGLPAIVFRLAGIYGPTRNRIRFVKEGKWQPPTVDKYMNMIHRDDIVTAMPVLFNRAEVGQVYLGVDDEPVRRSEFFYWLCQKLGMPTQKIETSQKILGKRCQNARLKSLGFSFKYPTFREGYSALLEAK